MKTFSFTLLLLVASMIATACDADVTSTTRVYPTRPPSTPTVTAELPPLSPMPTATEEWIPPDVLVPIMEADELEGEFVKLLSVHYDWDESTQWVEVERLEAEGEIVWVQVESISYYYAQHYEGEGGLAEYIEIPIMGYPFEKLEGTLRSESAELIGRWEMNRFWGGGSVDVWGEIYYLTEAEGLVYSLWSDFDGYFLNLPYVVDGIIDKSPRHLAEVLLANWWVTGWSWDKYVELYSYVHGYGPNPDSARTAGDFYGMRVEPEEDGRVLLIFSLPTPGTKVLGCLPQNEFSLEYYSAENFEVLYDRLDVMGDRGITWNGAEFYLSPYHQFIAVVEREDFPTWYGQYYWSDRAPEGVFIQPLEVWEVCN